MAWLEEAVLLTREENRVQVFPSSLRVSTLEDARARLEKADITNEYRKGLLTICRALFEADADEGISTDELMVAAGLTPEGVRKALHDLEGLGIASNDTAITAFVHAGVARNRVAAAFSARRPTMEEERAQPDAGAARPTWSVGEIGAAAPACHCPRGSGTPATSEGPARTRWPAVGARHRRRRAGRRVGGGGSLATARRRDAGEWCG